MDKSMRGLQEVMPIVKSDNSFIESALDRIARQKRIAFHEPIDEQIERDMWDDWEDVAEAFRLKNESIEIRTKRIKRYQRYAKEAKEECGFRCEICGETFEKRDGTLYCEAHHLIPISEDGSQGKENLAILCANHHRMFHYATVKIVKEMKITLLSKRNAAKHRTHDG